MREDVEPLHAGHAAQQSEQNAFPNKHAIDEPNEPMHKPIVNDFNLETSNSNQYKNIY